MSKKIAMLCMSLNIGGAETHIYELSKQLQREGNDITVFSNGGVYAQPLVEAGVRHIQTPLHNKKLSSLRASYRILLETFRRERPSVVHSHTRISNFIGGMVCKKLGIPLVTTVHFNFRSGFFFRRFSNWGCRALAVSEDLKTYLAENYHYDPNHIRLTVNGIDMERFKKQDAQDFRARLGIGPHQKMILLVSRLDKEASIHVAHFLRIAPAVFKAQPDCRVVIVGSGDCDAEFQQKAAEINRSCGTDFILLQGARTNIEEYTAAADLFIGISRSALEAMAAGVPAILLGNLGYLGLYSDKIKQECIETNLTCRGYPYPTDDALTALVLDCLGGKDLSHEIADGMRLVQERFSIKTMSETAMQQYEEAIQASHPLDYIISGYYGSDNFGDKLTLDCLMKHLKDKRGSVLTCAPAATNVPGGVQLIHRFDLWKIRKAMKQTKVFLLGSGSILQDATSNRSIFYYHFIMKMALRYHCKTMLYANGVGPIDREKNRKRTAALLDRFDLITARDQNTIDFLQELNVQCPALLTADDSFSYDFSAIQPHTPAPEAMGKTIVGINFKLDPNRSRPLLNEIAEALKTLAARHSLYFYLIPFHLEQDRPALEQLQQMIPEISRLADATTDPKELISYIAMSDYQIFERLHGQMITTALGIPFVPIQYDPKNRSFLEAIGLSEYPVNHADITAEKLISAFEKMLANQSVIRKQMADYTAKAHTAAQQNSEKLIHMIESY